MTLLLQYMLMFASVLLLVALGGCFSEHSGVINIGLEGIMVFGALGGALMMKYMPDGTAVVVVILLTTLMAMIFGMLYSLLLAVAAINFKADQTLVGTAMNLLGTAAATVIVKAINIAEDVSNVSSAITYINVKKAFLVDINGFEFNWFMLMAAMLLVISYVLLYKTRFGLRLQACGEHPQAADSVGINVYKMRYAGVMISGVLGGFGGIGASLPGFRVEIRERRGGLRLPCAGGDDFRAVEAQRIARGASSVCSARFSECLHGLRLPHGDATFPSPVYNMMPYIISPSCWRFQNVPGAPRRRGHPLRQAKPALKISTRQTGQRLRCSRCFLSVDFYQACLARDCALRSC